MMYPVMTRRPVTPAMMMDRMFRDMNRFCAAPGRPPRPAFRVDVRQTEDAYLIEAELPGVKLEDISITLEQDVLTIAADVNTAERTDENGYLHTERRSGHMERAFTLEGIRQADITAESVNGVLTVTLPKEAPETGKEKRQIAIKGASAPVLPAAAEA